MSWLSVIGTLVNRIPVERVLFPPRDNVKSLEKFAATMTAPVAENLAPPEQKTTITLPTTEETVQELKRRLAKELYRMEMDLQEGARIAGGPCDCLSAKHTLGLQATAEELMSYEANPAYGKITTWLRTREPEFEPEEIAQHPPEYYQALAPEVRAFRKEVMGTESPGALLTPEESELTLEEAKTLAAEEAAKEVESRWQSQETKPSA